MFYDIRINLLKVDATREMKVNYRARGKNKNVSQDISAGKTYFISHFAEFGAYYEEEKVKAIFKAIKRQEAQRNPYLPYEPFALVTSDKDITQEYVNRIVDYKNYKGELEKEEEEVEEIDKLSEALRIMEDLADENLPYSQLPPRSGHDEKARASMDCSEFVSNYLYSLGITSDVLNINTSEMIDEKNFISAIGSNKIAFVEGSDKKDFIPQKGDIFVWRRGDPKNDGHTGVVLEYKKDIDAVVVLESIGGCNLKSIYCSGDETFSRKNGGNKRCCSSRKAVYQRLGGALYNHDRKKYSDNWKGYFRPVLK